MKVEIEFSKDGEAVGGRVWNEEYRSRMASILAAQALKSELWWGYNFNIETGQLDDEPQEFLFEATVYVEGEKMAVSSMLVKDGNTIYQGHEEENS